MANAYETLSDPQKRQQHDNPNPFHHTQAGPNGSHFEFNFGGGAGPEDIYWIASSPVMDKICNFNEIRANSSDPLDWQVQMANWVKSPDMGLRFQALKSQYPIRILRTAEMNLDTISDWDKIPPN